MKLPKYSEVVKLAEDAKRKILAPARANRAKKQAELEMAKLEEEVADKTADLHEQCSSEKVDFAKIIELQDKIALVERKMKQYQKILDEMFPDD